MAEKPNQWRRFGYAVSFLIVAGVAAYVSFGHIYEVATIAHQPKPLALALPLSVDGLMLIATLAMSEDKAANRSPRAWARIGFWLGAAVSVAANLASTLVHYGPQPLNLAVAGWAPIALLVSIEIVARPGKPKEETPAPATELKVPTEAEMAALPEAPTSPAPSGSKIGRPSIPAVKGPAGKMVHAVTGEPLKDRTERRKRNSAAKAAE